MGKWNRRYIPSRKRYRHYDYEDPIPTFDDRSDVSDTHNHNVPQWEINYCKSVRVPWRKVVASKKYCYCYPNVREWDDSCGAEALNNAKQRYWSTINGHQCEVPLPDPNMYIDEVDWDTPVDTELMADLDVLFYDPNHEQQNVRKLATIEEDIGARLGSDNPWEGNHTVVGDGVLVDGWGWRVDSEDREKGSPWEQNRDRPVDSLNNCAWESGKNSRDWRVDSQTMKQGSSWERNCDRPADYRNNCAWESGKNTWDRRVDSQHVRKSSYWEKNQDRPVDPRNSCALESGNNSWDKRVDSQITNNSNAWDQNYDKPVNHGNHSGWGSGNDSRDQGFDLQKQTNWGRNCSQGNAITREAGSNSWDFNERTNGIQRFGNSVKRWRQRESNSCNPNAQDQDSRLNNHRNFQESKRGVDVNDRNWRGRDEKSRGQRRNRGGSFRLDNHGDRRRFFGNNC